MIKIIIINLIFLISIVIPQQRIHPGLVLNESDISAIKKDWGKYPVFKQSFLEVKEKTDKALTIKTDVPQPMDAGGYTHEKHKQNYNEMYNAGLLYSVTGEKKYAEFVKGLLLKYAAMYPILPIHPQGKGKSPGKLFYQSLNENVFLVHTTQAYDFIYNYLTPSERKEIEEGLFRNIAHYLAVERVEEIDLIHNHATWACAAVGMAGLILGDNDLVNTALYGSKKDGEYGFLKQLEMLISPDGYYTEGPYYVRYAIWPMFLFAKVIQNNRPEIKIFEFRNQILKKVFYSAIQTTYTNGAFIPFNDALKEKTYLSPEVVLSLNMVYEMYGQDKNLLGIAQKQNKVMLSKAGLLVAKELSANKSVNLFPYASVEYTDGAKGDEGGIGILRYGDHKDQSLLLMKYTGHGLSHGHYDKLSFLYYDQNREIIQDYGSSRFLNVETKEGGRYLPENKSYAMQSVAHNTVVADEKSHFNGKIEISEKFHSERHFFDAANKDIQIMSAKDRNAYKGIEMQRTMAMVKDKAFDKPFVVDIFKVKSGETHQYDLPFYFMGHIININIDYTAYSKDRKILGEKNGYQHLWKTAEGRGNGTFILSWINGERYYSIISNADTSAKIIFTEAGASDPDFNLRNDQGVMIRINAKNHVFASVLEPHGKFDGTNEVSMSARPNITGIKVLYTSDTETVAEITAKNNMRWILMINNGEASDTAEHTVVTETEKFNWKGNYSLIKK